jgi:ElaB/YqjD/DUF883 family membrane-anchored ribosome-binding protein
VEYCAEELEFGCSQQQKREDFMDITAATRAPIKGIKSATEDLMEQASELSERMGKTANDALKQSKRALGRLQDSTEDVIQDTRQNIRKNPFESVVIAAGVGAAVGMVIGYLLGSRRR